VARIQGLQVDRAVLVGGGVCELAGELLLFALEGFDLRRKLVELAGFLEREPIGPGRLPRCGRRGDEGSGRGDDSSSTFTPEARFQSV
jgi:hypothetical protein